MNAQSLTIRLHDVTKARILPSRSSSRDDSDTEDHMIPFTRSPLDECRGSKGNSSTHVGDAHTKAHAHTQKHANTACTYGFK